VHILRLIYVNMDSDEDYEFDLDSVAIVEKDHLIESERNRANSPSSSENGDEYNSPPMLSHIHAMDIPSVRRPPVSVMVPTDRVSPHDLPLCEILSAVEGGLFHKAIYIAANPCRLTSLLTFI